MNGEKLACEHDTREETQLYHDNAVGIYLDEGEGIEIKLVGQVPVELSFTMQIFSLKRMSSFLQLDQGTWKTNLWFLVNIWRQRKTRSLLLF